MTQTYYRKVSVKERLPEEMQEVICLTDYDRAILATIRNNENNAPVWHSLEWKKEISDDDIPETIEHIIYWLEPLPIKESMSIQEAKDEVARKYGFGNWLALITNLGYGFMTEQKQDEAMQLYLISNQPKEVELPSDEEIEKHYGL